MSRVFDGVEVRFWLAFGGSGVECRGALRTARCEWLIVGRGGAVKAGPLGPPVGGALTAPGLSCRQPPSDWTAPQAVLVARGGWTQQDLTIAQDLSWATESSATGHSFAVVRMVCSGHSQTGTFK